MKKLYLISIIVLVALCSCSIKTIKTEVNPNSTISVVSDSIGTTPDEICKLISIGNAVGLEKNYFTAKQAEEFVKEIVDVVIIAKEKQSVTLQEVISYAIDKYNILPERVQAALIIIDPTDLSDTELKLELSDDDFNLIINCLNKQISLINIYL